MSIKIGDVVLLKSGGATMTVSELEGDKATCIWHNPLPKGGFQEMKGIYFLVTLVLKSEQDAAYFSGLTGLAQRG